MTDAPVSFMDTETYSATPIRHGIHRYAESAETLLIAWAGIDTAVRVWDVTAELMPERFRVEILDADAPIVAHNAAFERTLLAHTMPQLDIAPSRWRCTMARAYAHSLPGSLGTLAEVLGLPVDRQKDRAGLQLIRRFCMPQAANRTLRRKTRVTRPMEWQQFIEYCRQDVVVLREIWNRLPCWNMPANAFELAAWRLDQEICQRGVAVDMRLVEGAISAIEREQQRLAQRTREITHGEVGSTTQRDRLIRHIAHSYDIDLPDLTPATIERRIDDPDVPQGLRELLTIRLQASRSSTAKYKAIQRAVSADGRVRGLIQYCGASRTGRASGRIINPLNFLRPTLPQHEIELGIEALTSGCADLLFDDVMNLTANTMRGVIVAPAGKKLVVADLANIEGRVLAWLAGETWKLDAYRAFDAGEGPDVYKLAYAKSFGVRPDDVTKEQRQVGKVMELALGFGAGAAAFVAFAATYGIDLDVLAESAAPTLPADVLEEAIAFHEWCGRHKKATFGLSKKGFVVCDALKRMWRRAHPAITSYWRETEDQLRAAINAPATTHDCRRTRMRRDDNWLRVRLPSGRFLCYPSPRIDTTGVSYMGMNQYSRRWERVRTFGGKAVENLVQGVARDVFYHAAPIIEASGYEIVLHVYDEYVTEAPDREGFNDTHLCTLLSTTPAWADGLPLAASGFSGPRYRKG
ncbi:DNA polymerase I [Caballeronia catudaia]|uniref:DNA-directed DNA polymerase n=1 Tax=Caballeronia catudaia TaxID=1777136 RepID=A0A158CLW2_9BURK|nr:DNA polymerase [Caballeronia catudaia]SAK83345.1 DNA polymerase I [Caballeronia catudaia]